MSLYKLIWAHISYNVKSYTVIAEFPQVNIHGMDSMRSIRVWSPFHDVSAMVPWPAELPPWRREDNVTDNDDDWLGVTDNDGWGEDSSPKEGDNVTFPLTCHRDIVADAIDDGVIVPDGVEVIADDDDGSNDGWGEQWTGKDGDDTDKDGDDNILSYSDGWGEELTRKDGDNTDKGGSNGKDNAGL